MPLSNATLEQEIEAALCSSQTSSQQLLSLLLRVSAAAAGVGSDSDPAPVYSVNDSSSGPAANAAEVTPSDATVIDNCRSIYVGTGGNLVVTIGGNVVTFVVPDGTWMPIIVTQVMAATDAEDIVVVW